MAVGLGERLGAHVTAATAAPEDAAGAAALGPVRARWPELETVAAVGPPAAALCKLAESGRYDLLVVGNRGIGGYRSGQQQRSNRGEWGRGNERFDQRDRQERRRSGPSPR